MRIDLDLKEPGLADDALAAAGAADNEVVSSFYSDALWEVRSLDAEATLAYNFDARLDRSLNTTRLLDCARANVHWSLRLGTDAVDRAKAQGLDVYAWPVGSRLVAWAVGRAGVDGVIATRPSVREWARPGRRGEAFDRLPASETALDRLPESGAVARVLGRVADRTAARRSAER